ncbi:uncharacterized protein N7500_007181 [Penicillium coprophilum]|uniref:uncharacterized protein n=1 Tax=Penicillium coprophilum TaxID=36646 RepID=UPI00239F1F52|nr:uncharacterized protein N7500_007181 [Penicillium coprophilum]KAJ5165351.1 hypothetical protein N7500_007181 [Penicillium coprophilum]
MRDWPPWTAAFATGHGDVLQVLIEEGEFVPRARDLFNTAIDGDFETLKILVRGCRRSIDLADPESTAVLGIAIYASSDNLDIARFLIDSGSPVNCMDNDQHTSLAYAADSGNIETVKLLLGHGADPDPETMAAKQPVALRILYELALMLSAMQMTGCTFPIVLLTWMMPAEDLTADIT